MKTHVDETIAALVQEIRELQDALKVLHRLKEKGMKRRRRRPLADGQSVGASEHPSVNE